MTAIQKIIAVSALSMGISLPVSGLAQTASMTDGEVRKVDLNAGKVTIKHGPITHMDMPGMTMVFTAKNKDLLAKVKAGDKVRFMVENDGGKMLVTDLQPAP